MPVNKWEYILPKDISSTIQSCLEFYDIEGLQSALTSAATWITKNVPDLAEDYLLNSLMNGSAYPFMDEESIMYCLNNFYDICDENRIWLDLTDPEPMPETSEEDADWIMIDPIVGNYSDKGSVTTYLTEEGFQEIYKNLMNQGFMEEVASTDIEKTLWKLAPGADSKIIFKKIDK